MIIFLSAVPSAVTGLSAALQTVGRSNVKIGGTGGEYQNFVNIASGTESAWVNQGTEGVGFNEIDAGLHGLAGGKYQYKSDIYVPLVLVTKSNLANWVVRRQRRQSAPTRFRLTTWICIQNCGTLRRRNRTSSADSFL